MSDVKSQRLARFRAEVATLAQRVGISDLIVVVRDPASGETVFFATTTGKAALRDTIIEKLGLAALDGADESETYYE